MKRHMARSIVRPEHWPKLSKGTMEFIESDKYASRLFTKMRNTAESATDWYDRAEKDREIARWIPQGGGGDCFLIYPGETDSSECVAMYDALVLYVSVIGQTDVYDELSNLREAFVWLDMEEVA